MQQALPCDILSVVDILLAERYYQHIGSGEGGNYIKIRHEMRTNMILAVCF